MAAIEQFSLGGMDSRSNPVNMPQDRAIYCANWAPNQAGFLELRKGYSAVPMHPTIPKPIHSLAGYQLWSGESCLLAGADKFLMRIPLPSAFGSDPTVFNNMIVNGNFQKGEALSAGWAKYSFAASPIQTAIEGAYITNGIAYTSEHIYNNPNAAIYQIIDVEPGVTYSYAALLFKSYGAPGYGRIFIGSTDLNTTYNSDASSPPSGSVPPFYCGNQSPQNYISGMQTSGTSRWELKAGTVTIPAGVTRVAVLIQAVNTDVYTNGVMFWRGTKWQDYCEADIVGSLPGVGKNLILNNEDFSAWGTKDVAPSVSRLAATDPNGNATASKITFGVTTAGHFSKLEQSTPLLPPLANRTLTFSVWLRSDAATTINLQIYDGIPPTTNAMQSKSITAAWQRFSVTATFGANPGSQIIVSLYNDSSQPGKVIYAWGAQLEYGVVATEYVKNTGAAKWDTFYANNQVHIGNGTQLVYFDGKKLRNNGIRSLTDVEVASITVGAIGTTGWGPTSVGGAQPGWQLYLALYNPTTRHVGNRVKIGNRIAFGAPCGFVVTGLPNLSAEDPELVKLFGVTIDGGEVPYAVCDSGYNWVYASNSATSITFNTGLQDFASELPSRNGIPPAMDKFCRIEDFTLGCGPGSPFIYFSGSESSPLNPLTVGRPEQSWAPDDVQTFPTREVPTALWAVDGDAFVFSRNSMDILAYLEGYWVWRGTRPIGCAGQRSFARSIHGDLWVTGDKQLATVSESGPVPISGEYEAALLSRIGDAYLGDVELVPLVDIANQKDELIIKCKDSSGNPFEIVHDFKLRDSRSPYGQAYLRNYVGILASGYTLAQARDEYGKLHAYAGGADGCIYKTVDGYTDNGTEIPEGEYIQLLNGGPNRVSIEDIQLWGDDQVKVDILRRADKQKTDFQPLGMPDGSGEKYTAEDGQFRLHFKPKNPEMELAYIRIRLAGHSVDAPALPLNDPPHLPLETYGRVYMSRALTGTPRPE